MTTTDKQTLSITVEGDEVAAFKSALKTVLIAEKAIGFNRYPLGEREVKLLTEIDKQINK